MKFQKRTKYILLVVLALLNILIRYPISAHENSTSDSFFVHGLATSISENGYAKWVIHPLSLTGAYPLSYGSMYPFFLSGISTVTGISIEEIILVTNMLLSIFAMLSIFLIVKIVISDDLSAFLTAFIFSVSPIFLFFTNWTASARGAFILLFPLFIFLLLKCNNKYKFAFLTLFLGLVLLTTHRLSYFTPLFFIAYVATILFMNISVKNGLTIYFTIFNKKLTIDINKFIFFSLIIFIMFLVQYGDISRRYSTGISANFINIGLFNSFLNFVISYMGRIGIFLIFVIPGFIHLTKIKEKKFGSIFIIIASILLIMAVSIREYTPIIFALFLAIFIGIGIAQTILLINERKPKLNFIVIGIILLTSLITGNYVNDHWGEASTNQPMLDETFNAALFIKEKINNTGLTNNGVIGSQIQAISGMPIIPLDVQLWFNPSQLIYGFEKKENLETKILPIKELLPPPDVWYKFYGVSNVKDDYQAIMYNDINSEKPKENILKYNITYFVSDKTLGNRFYSYGLRGSTFIGSMKQQESKIFENNLEEIWYLG